MPYCNSAETDTCMYTYTMVLCYYIHVHVHNNIVKLTIELIVLCMDESKAPPVLYSSYSMVYVEAHAIQHSM